MEQSMMLPKKSKKVHMHLSAVITLSNFRDHREYHLQMYFSINTNTQQKCY